ncbi:MAG: ATP-binding cassette subfamily B multidrug efflux pump, partial [Planctomycetota bacterium]
MSERNAGGEVVASKAWDHAIFLRLLGFARPHLKLFLQSFSVLSCLFALDLAGPWIWRNALDGPIEASKLIGSQVVTGAERSFLFWIAAYVGVLLVTFVFRYLEVAQIARTGQAVIHDLRYQLFRHMQSLDLAFFDRQPTGSLVTRVTSDVENLSEMFTSGVVVLAFDILKVCVLLCILFAMDVQMATVVVCMVPILVGISISFRGGARRAHREVRAKLSMKNGYLQEVLQGIRVVQLFRREERSAQRFDELLDDYFESNRRTIFLFALFFPSMAFGVYAIQGAVLWFAGNAMTGGALSLGVFVQFWFYLNMLVGPIRDLGERYNILQSAFASAERIFQVIDTKATILTPDKPAEVSQEDDKPPHLSFEGVSFSYNEGVEVISDVSFEIPSGHSVALVGATGSGKSTLVNLLLRFYDPTAGSVRFNGIDARELDPTQVREHFGLVLQEDFLFTGNVRDNIVMERDGISDQDLKQALRYSRAAGFLERSAGSLNAGLSAAVAERGATFSTGERQLLAIARALAGHPNMIVLDEATANVDSATEAAIEEATDTLLAGRSALIVAHRLSTIRKADQILVMHAGRITERGTHDEL